MRNTGAGLASSFSCGLPCECGLSFQSAMISPSQISAIVGQISSFQAQEMRTDCFNTFGPYNRTGDSLWTTSNSSVATVSGGTVHFLAPGAVTIHGQFTGTVYTNFPSPCQTQMPVVNPGSSGQVVQVAFGAVTRGTGLPDSLPPGKTKSISVTITPSLSGTNNVQFDIIGGSTDNGTATISGTSTLTASGTITIQGGNQTAPMHAGNLKVRARLNGSTDLGTSNGFSVCAHVSSLDLQLARDNGNGSILFAYNINSDSDQYTDLNQCMVGEIVTYPGSSSPYIPTNPPFTSWGLTNPTVNEGDGSLGVLLDQHFRYGAVTAGPAASFSGTQFYRYRCLRCGSGYVNLLGPYTIDRVVENVGGWRFRVTKNGTSGTVGLPVAAP